MNYNTDDRLFPTALTVMWEYAQKHIDVDVFYSPCFITNSKAHTPIVGMHDWLEFSKEALLANCILGPFPLVRTKVVEEAGWFNPEFNISGDYEMWLRLESRGCRFKKIEEPIGKYFNNPEGVSSNKETFQEHVRQDMKIRSMYG